MNQYLLSVYEVEGQVTGAPSTPEEMQAFMGRVIALEEEMDRAGAHQRTASMITSGGNRNPAKLDRGTATAAGR